MLVSLKAGHATPIGTSIEESTGRKAKRFLTLVGERDLWLSEYGNGGRLRKFPQYEVGKPVGSIPTGTLRTRHELFEATEVKQDILKFLRDHFRA